MKTPLRVLIVDNSEGDAERIVRQLKKAEYAIHHERVETAKAMKSAIDAHTWDIIISDYKLSRFSARAALDLLKNAKIDIPFIVVSSIAGEEKAVELMKAGADGYLMKSKLLRLSSVVKRELAETRLRRKHKNNDAEILLLAQAVKSTKDCISITDLGNNILFVNDSFAETYGYSEAELRGKNISIIRSSSVTAEEITAVQSGTMTQGWHGEIFNKRKNGTEFPVELWTSVIKNKSGHPAAMIGVARDITERKRAERELRERDIQFNKLASQVPGMIYQFMQKPDGTYCVPFTSEGIRDIFGCSPQDVRNDFSPIAKIIVPEDLPVVVNSIKNSAHHLTPWHCEYRVQLPGQSIRWLYGQSMPEKLNDGSIIWHGFNTDITERKLAENELRKSDTQLANAIKIAKLGPWEYDVVQDTFTFNDNFYALFRTTAQQAGGYTMSSAQYAKQFVHPDDLPMVGDEIKKAIETTYPDYSCQMEHRFLYADGTIGYIAVRILIVKDTQGRTIKTYGVNQDITLRKQAEEALRQSKESYRKLFEDHSAVKLILDPDTGLIIDANHAASQYYGWKRDDLKKMNINQINTLSPEEVKTEMEKARLLKRIQFEFRHRRADGSIRDVEVFSSKIEFEGKEVLHSIVHDITERHHTENALRESQALYHSFVEHMPAGVFRKDSEGRYVFVNSYFCQLKGLKADEILGKTPHELAAYEAVIENSRSLEMKGIQRTLANQGMDHHKLIMNKGKSIELEEIYLQPDGTTKYYHVVKSPVYASDGKIIGSQGVQFDITEHKRAEEARHESEKLFRDLFNASPDAIVLIDPHHAGVSWSIVDCNEAACKMNGYVREELVGQSIDVLNNSVGTPDERSAYIENIRQKGIIHMETSHRHKDGHIFPIEVSTSIVSLGGREMVLGIDRDITNRRQVEEKLKESEEQFEKFMANLPAAAFIKDSESRLLYANQTLKELFGWQDAVGKLTSELLPADLARKMIADDKRVLEEGSSIVHEKVTDIHGVDHFFETHKFPFYKNNDEVLLGAVSIDETERIIAEKILQESEERYRRLVEFSPDAIAVHSEGKIVYVNPAAITLLGANNASELIGKPYFDIIHPEFRDSIHQQIIAVMMEEYAIPLTEQKFMRVDGSSIEVEVAALPIVYKEKSAMQIVARDISEQKKLQNQLIQTQKIQSIGTLAGGIAHDFNNILGIILAYSSLLSKGVVSPDKFADSIAAINQAVQRGAALVRQILTFARKTDIVYEPMDIAELIRELLSMLGQTFPKTITFSESNAENLPFIFADRTQIHQALLNLCINARDAMPDGGLISIATGKQRKEQMTHQFPAADAEEYVCLTVTDTGKGMDEATRLRVFDPFFTTKEKGKGTGLGLSVVYGVVQAHHGFIDLHSEPGSGTTFRLFFPVPTANKQPADSQVPAASFEIGGSETILFVEDEEMLIQMVTFLLESKGYKVFCAHDGLEALQVYQSHQQEIALVLTDMGLPVLTGSDEFKKLKEINPNVKVIFASGYFEPDIKSELLKDGANGFIQKPYEPDHILRMIRQVLDQKV
jgi:PAS domain S-box-containing protein